MMSQKLAQPSLELPSAAVTQMFGQARAALAVQPVAVPNSLVLWEGNLTLPWKS